MNIRALAARSLAPVLLSKASLDTSFEQFSEQTLPADRALFRELCFGVCRQFFVLQAILDKLLGKPLKEKDSDLRALLLLGLYQLMFLRVPDHAAINETVNATKALKKAWAKNLVNGVLRSFTREQDALVNAVQQTDAAANHPTWMIKALRQAWPNEAAEIFTQNNRHAPFTLRINRRLVERENVSKQLHQLGMAHQLSRHSPEGITLSSATDVAALPGFAAGHLSVQDEAAQLAAHLLELDAGQRVLDACCAPGGKTCHIAELQPQLEALVAVEVEGSRLQRVRENLARLGLQATVLHADGRDLTAWWDGQHFDRILLDAPCSATGVIRRHPDIKLLRRETDIATLVELQQQLLQALWQTLTPGGILVYATCSLLPAENENLVASFVETQEDAIHYPIDALWGEQRSFGRQLFPQPDGHDGFYYARLKKLD